MKGPGNIFMLNSAVHYAKGPVLDYIKTPCIFQFDLFNLTCRDVCHF